MVMKEKDISKAFLSNGCLQNVTTLPKKSTKNLNTLSANIRNPYVRRRRRIRIISKSNDRHEVSPYIRMRVRFSIVCPEIVCRKSHDASAAVHF